MGVSQLGYVRIGATDIDAWLDIIENIIGWEILPRETGSEIIRCRVDNMHHRVALEPADKDDVLFAGWQVESEAEFDDVVAKLKTAGVQPVEASADECADRRVFRMAKFNDIEGYPNELYYRPVHHHTAFNPSLPISGFEAGHLGLGHVMRHCKDYPGMVAFYRDVLGFRISDQIVTPALDATFMRCNARHHSIALVNEALGHEGGDTNHIMVQVKDIDDVGRAYDEVLRRKLPIIMTLGRHCNDETTSFYFVGPSGFGIEIGCGCLLVDEATWTVKTYNETRKWGHLFPHERGE